MKRTRATLILTAIAIGLQAQVHTPSTIEEESGTKSGRHTLIANYSPGWITSKVVTDDNDEYSWQSGTGYELDYRFLSDSGYGFSLNYASNKTDYPAWMGYYRLDLRYYGASFVYGGSLSDHWIATVEAGLGYTTYEGKKKTEGGFGTRWGLSLEYRLTQTFGLGVNIVHIVHTFPDEDKNKRNDDTLNGFKRLAMNLGLRIYL